MASGRRSILFLTNSELGQATVCMAVAHEFLLRPEYDVHLASFSSLSKAVTDLNVRSKALSDGASEATFHTISGKSMKEAAGRKTEFIEMHRPGFRGAIEAYNKVLPATFASWNGSEYMIGYSSCVEIIENVNPDILVVDPLFSQGIDACQALSRKFIILSPNTFKDHAIREQPKGAALWKYPQICTGWPYPVPWYLILANIYLTIRVVLSRLFSPLLKELIAYRNACGVPGRTPSIFQGFGPDVHVLLPSTPETDFPFVIPSNFTACGPMVLPVLPVSQTHPELDSWLRSGPTVLVNLGSHILFDEAFAEEFATGLRILLDRRPDVQVLWKLKTQGQIRERLQTKNGAFEVIAKELTNGRVRIEDWLPTDPIAILETGHIICMIHHGGSNSYHEAISAGVPQIVLPVWIDTYDFATRVEWLGIGVWGSRTAAPRVKAPELGGALVRVIDSSESDKMREKAMMIARGLGGGSSGRSVACEKIIELSQDRLPMYELKVE